MILLSFMMIVYSLYFLLNFVHTETPVFFKIMPLGICFIGLDSVLRKVTSLNSISFMPQHLKLGYIAKRSIVIPYEDIQSLDLQKKITFYMIISYRDKKGELQQLKTPASFPHILEIMFNLAEMAEQAVIPEKMQGILEYLKANADNEL
ncbi:MAG: hypothetical protein PHY24_07225 [Candidatus Cloacimonetes bacterium]|nr:hypothetical protein [Candidatus Cloacimonadota bacterium]MDD3533900.1 hypothetical protein [Candidatus Cloacimonadota bacterium]